MADLMMAPVLYEIHKTKQELLDVRLTRQRQVADARARTRAASRPAAGGRPFATRVAGMLGLL